MDHLQGTDGHVNQTPPLLWRETLGRVLRLRRTELALTLAQVSARSGVSTQYLSEVERGLKDPSSEVIEAIAMVLGLPLPQVLVLAAIGMQQELIQSGTLQLAGLSTTRAAPASPLSGRAQLSLVA